MKTTNITNHGTIVDTINIKGYIESQAHRETFQGTKRKVVNIKSKTQPKKLGKILKNNSRTR